MARKKSRKKAEKIAKGITDKIECNTVDIDDWAEFWGFTREEYEEFLDTAIKALEQESKWIPCSEKKPDEGGEYLLWGKIDESEEEDYCFIGDYHEFDEAFGTEISHYDPKTLGFIDAEIKEYYSVVAWMPLPKPYKVESEE